MYEYGTLKLAKAIFKKGKGKRENNGGNETKWATLYAYMEISEQNPLHN
jgi:hypothetical protein